LVFFEGRGNKDKGKRNKGRGMKGVTQERITVDRIKAKKKSGEKITMLTAYDYPLASLVDQAGIDIILVGDSLANVVLGLESTKEVGMAEMIHHARAVSRAVKNALVVGDMPFEAYQTDTSRAAANAGRFIEEGGCQAVKLEWFDHCLEVVSCVAKAGIPVMGHVGLTPQTADKLGGYRVQGKDAASARKIIDHARALEEQGCFCVVLECVPSQVAEAITKRLSIPTIGIGAGRNCDGQVLVTPDLLGFSDQHKPKFVKQYVDVRALILEGLRHFRDDVTQGLFPDEAHSYRMDPDEVKKLY